MEDRQKREIRLAQNIADLRKKRGMTQEELASILFVSNKTVSKWERGAGYPELPQIVKLSEVFGVSLDRLLVEDRRGIAIAGNLLTDNVKMIDTYPKTGMLSNITSLSRAVGGCVPNVGIDLASIDRSLPLTALGRIGDDEAGQYVMMELSKNGLDVSGVITTSGVPTGFSDVMTVESTGERTFFHHRGANALFSPADVKISSLHCKMLHIGYILLLDSFDRADPEYGTAMAGFLKDVREAGIKTSFDVVSDSSGHFAEKVIPALRYTDNVIMNEIEACAVAGIEARDETGAPAVARIRSAMEKIISHGVGERVIVHCPEAGFILRPDGTFTALPSLVLPEGFIKGSVGAGDAFCAGCLYGICNGYDDEEILSFASGAAACSLSAGDSVSGMRPRDKIKELIQNSQRQTVSGLPDQ